MDFLNDDLYIAEEDRYTEGSALEALMKLSDNGTPLPLLFRELYGKRRIVFYSTQEICLKFAPFINTLLFYYDTDILFCADTDFTLRAAGYEWTLSFCALDHVRFREQDVFFVFHPACRKEVIEKVRAQKIKGLTVEAFRKKYVGALNHYITRIRPVKNLVALNPGVRVLLIDNFTPDPNHFTEWEKYLYENRMTREKTVELLKEGTNPYPEGQYSQPYTTEELLSMHVVPDRVADHRGVLMIKDYSSEYVNTEGGIRRTIGQPASYDRTIYVFGGCGFFGIGMPDRSTFASRLQALLNEGAPQERIRVVNYGSFIWGKQDALWYIVNSVRYRDGDILILPYNYGWAKFFYNKIPNILYADVTARRGGEIFNDMWHPSENGLKVYAENLFYFLKENDFLKTAVGAEGAVKLCRPKQYGIPPFADSMNGTLADTVFSEESTKDLLKKYIAEISAYRPKIGAIVMNCNPFTLGHRYLIEYAASRAERLYIFAVEEDKSFFPFADRIDLIRKGVADLKNVTVLPSGKFIISSLTFKEYFGKAELQDRKIDASLDVQIFGQYIAPALGINVRFAGEEPFDKVTLQYNEQMKTILPSFGIEFVEVPRKEEGGAAISASRVRALLKEKKFEEIRPLVPKTTYEYLVSRFQEKEPEQ